MINGFISYAKKVRNIILASPDYKFSCSLESRHKSELQHGIWCNPAPTKYGQLVKSLSPLPKYTVKWTISVIQNLTPKLLDTPTPPFP